MKRRIVFSMLAVAGLAAFASAKSADAATIFNRNARHGCCEPACCEPEPVCCEEEVSCCEDPCCRERRRPMRDLCAGIRGMFHRDRCDDCCDDCCEPEPVCCDPEPVCCEEEVSCCEDPCCHERRRPLRDLCDGIRGMFHRDCCDDGCDDCCEPVCCDPEPDCCGH